MGEIFLDKTISLLSSDKQKARSDGLAGCFISYLISEITGANSIDRLEAHITAEQEELQAVSSQLPQMNTSGY